MNEELKEMKRKIEALYLRITDEDEYQNDFEIGMELAYEKVLDLFKEVK